MIKRLYLLFICCLLISQVAMSQGDQTDFVSVVDQSFYIGNKEYSYIGTNYWQGMNLGAKKSGDRKRRR